jgi:acyl-CoA synthetase (AMP-forming)/AMP-acid ligase II
VTHGSRTLTYGEVADQAEHIAAVLAARGISRGSRVIWWGDTTVDAVPLFFGLSHLGAVLVPLNPKFSKTEATNVMDQADPALVLSDEAHDGELTLEEVLASRRPSVVDLPEVDEQDAHMIFFTSGTTGQPKGVVLSQRADMLRGLTTTRSWPAGPSIIMFPQFHMAGWMVTPLSSWMAGEEVIFVDGGDPEALLGAIERHRAYRMYCLPAIWQRILESDRSRFDTSSLREADTGTSATSLELIRGLRRAFPQTTTAIGYGSTEAGPVAQLWPEDAERKSGSVGPPWPGVYLALDEGELLVRSAHLMSGYFRDAEATATAMSGGWYHTGDLAEIDEDGFVHIVGRVKDTVRTAGETVAPAEVDLVIQEHPLLEDAAVAGVPDEHWGEVITAFVVLRPGKLLDLRTLRRFCEGRLAPYKHPRRIVRVDSIPRTSTTGQVQRRQLVEIAISHTRDESDTAQATKLEPR